MLNELYGRLTLNVPPSDPYYTGTGKEQLKAAKKEVDLAKKSRSIDLKFRLWTTSNMSERDWEILIDYIKEKLPNLKSLYIENIGIKRLPNNINKLTQLKSLDISGNLSDLGEGFKLKRLESLRLSNCKFTSVPSPVLDLPALDYLDMHGNRLGKLHSSVFKIRNVNFGDCRITEIVGKPVKVTERNVIHLSGGGRKNKDRNRMTIFPQYLHPALRNKNTRVELHPFSNDNNIAAMCEQLLLRPTSRMPSDRVQYDRWRRDGHAVNNEMYPLYLALISLLDPHTTYLDKGIIKESEDFRGEDLGQLNIAQYVKKISKIIEKKNTKRRSSPGAKGLSTALDPVSHRPGVHSSSVPSRGVRRARRAR